MRPFIITTILLFFFVGTLAQDRATRERSAAQSKYTTEFNDMNMNFVNLRVQSFLSDKMSMTAKGEGNFNVADGVVTIEQDYVKKIQINRPEQKMTVKFKCTPQGNDLIIKETTISGYYDYVVEFYVKYWNTTFNFEDTKENEIVTNYWITDRISLSVKDTKFAIIQIVKNQL